MKATRHFSPPQLRRHLPFYLAALCAIAVALLALFFRKDLVAALAANTFFVVYLVLAGMNIPRMTVAHLKKHASTNDEPVWIIFLVTFMTVIIAVVSLFILINQKPHPGAFALVTTLAAVPLGWFTIHMMAAIHYAHLYWQRTSGEKQGTAAKPCGGLKFPGTPEPCGSDFIYFAYVIGMTAQTSDTSITTPAMRRINIVHSIVSFLFNTILVAAAVNVAVTLGG